MASVPFYQLETLSNIRQELKEREVPEKNIVATLNEARKGLDSSIESRTLEVQLRYLRNVQKVPQNDYDRYQEFKDNFYDAYSVFRETLSSNIPAEVKASGFREYVNMHFAVQKIEVAPDKIDTKFLKYMDEKYAHAFSVARKSMFFSKNSIEDPVAAIEMSREIARKAFMHVIHNGEAMSNKELKALINKNVNLYTNGLKKRQNEIEENKKENVQNYDRFPEKEVTQEYTPVEAEPEVNEPIQPQLVFAEEPVVEEPENAEEKDTTEQDLQEMVEEQWGPTATPEIENNENTTYSERVEEEKPEFVNNTIQETPAEEINEISSGEEGIFEQNPISESTLKNILEEKISGFKNLTEETMATWASRNENLDLTNKALAQLIKTMDHVEHNGRTCLIGFSRDEKKNISEVIARDPATNDVVGTYKIEPGLRESITEKVEAFDWQKDSGRVENAIKLQPEKTEHSASISKIDQIIPKEEKAAYKKEMSGKIETFVDETKEENSKRQERAI